jgi:ankyrin repeat protein
LAATNGNRELIELLINHCGLNVNEQGHRAITPVICAARNGRIEALIDLVEEFNADLTIRDEEENT